MEHTYSYIEALQGCTVDFHMYSELLNHSAEFGRRSIIQSHLLQGRPQVYIYSTVDSRVDSPGVNTLRRTLNFAVSKAFSALYF